MAIIKLSLRRTLVLPVILFSIVQSLSHNNICLLWLTFFVQRDLVGPIVHDKNNSTLPQCSIMIRTYKSATQQTLNSSKKAGNKSYEKRKPF